MAVQTNTDPVGNPLMEGYRPVFPSPSRLATSGRAELQPRVLNGTVIPSLLDEPMLELELALAHFERQRPFADTVAEAAESAGGTFLFELPAGGLVADCSRLAVVRLPSGGGMVTVFACLDLDGETIRVQAPDEQTRPLSDVADAFVNVLQHM